MSTPQQVLESFLNEKAAAYSEANARLTSIYMEYFGKPLAEHSDDFLLPEGVKESLEEIKQSGDTAVIVTLEHHKVRDPLRRRYHLAAAAVSDGWKMVRIDWECIFCHGTGRADSSRACQQCGGDGWYDPRKFRG